VIKKLQAIQGKYLRIITGAYRATATEALEIKTHTIPMDILLETQVAKTMLRLRESQAKNVVKRLTKRIRQQMRSKDGKQAKTRKTLGQRKEEWLKPQIAGALQEKTKTFPQAPWETTSDTPAPSRRKASERQAAEEENQGNQENQEEARQIRPKTRKLMIKERAEEEWKKRW
jgi:hypothetical protein